MAITDKDVAVSLEIVATNPIKKWDNTRGTITVISNADKSVLHQTFKIGDELSKYAKNLETELDKRLRQEYMDEDHRIGGIGITFEEFRNSIFEVSCV